MEQHLELMAATRPGSDGEAAVWAVGKLARLRAEVERLLAALRHYADDRAHSGEVAKRTLGFYEQSQRCEMCGEPLAGRDHSGCDKLPFPGSR